MFFFLVWSSYVSTPSTHGVFCIRLCLPCQAVIVEELCRRIVWRIYFVGTLIVLIMYDSRLILDFLMSSS